MKARARARERERERRKVTSMDKSASRDTSERIKEDSASVQITAEAPNKRRSFSEGPLTRLPSSPLPSLPREAL